MTCQDLAEQRLREHPTVPPGATLAEKDAGALWPRVFCAFDGCCWSEQDGTEEALHHHLAEVHATDLQGIAKHMLRGRADDALFSIYSAAIAEKCRSQAPLAGASLDRTALRSLANATADEQACAGKWSVCRLWTNRVLCVPSVVHTMVHKPTQLRKKFSFCILVRLAQGRIFGLCVLRRGVPLCARDSRQRGYPMAQATAPPAPRRGSEFLRPEFLDRA